MVDSLNLIQGPGIFMKDRVIVITAIGFIIIINYFVMSLTSFWWLAITAIFTYGVGLHFDSARVTIKRIKFFVFLFISLFVFHKIFQNPLHWIDVVQLSARTTFQIAILSQIIFLFARRTSLRRLLQSLSFIPSKLRLLLTITFSFIPVLLEEQEKISLVQKSRGLGNTFLSRLVSPLAIFVPLIHRVIQRSQSIATSIVARGYDN